MTVDILIGDVRAQLARLPADSFDCVVTSPPYWGLRDYGVDGQIGLERTLGEHLEVLVDVFEQVRRVLRPAGTLWLNYGDCYATAPNGRSAADTKAAGDDDRTFRDKPFSTVGPIYEAGHSTGRGQRGDEFRSRSPSLPKGRIVSGGYLKPKDLCMIPNRLAIALQEAGWWVRSEIIWHKPNPMPESVYDRPTSAHEKIWLLTQGEDYYYDHEAIREPVTGGAHARAPGPNSRTAVDRVPRSRKPGVSPKSAGQAERFVKANSRFHASTTQLVETKNARNVWTIAPQAFREAHFATFPVALAERCVRAGTPKTTCAACGAYAGCGRVCEVFGRVPGRVLDPFGGAGTVGLVAERLGLDCTLIELNPEYAELARRRIQADLAEADAA